MGQHLQRHILERTGGTVIQLQDPGIFPQESNRSNGPVIKIEMCIRDRSTASPFKFSDSVLAALGEPGDAPGTVLLERLAEKTGVPVPAPLAALDRRTVRFTECVEKEEMLRQVDAFLK